jgi:hypothetical protein
MKVLEFFIEEQCGFKWNVVYILFVALAYCMGGICILALTECYNAAYDLGVLAAGMNIYFQIYIPLVKIYSISFFVFTAFMIIVFASEFYSIDQQKKDTLYESWNHHYDSIDTAQMIDFYFKNTIYHNKILKNIDVTYNMNLVDTSLPYQTASTLIQDI